jgi:LytS/YehU family sensor histidine kinase
VHLVLGLAFALAKVLLEGSIRQWWFGVRPYLLINNLALQMLIYWALVGIVHAIDHYGRSRAQAAETEARLREAQLGLLRAQLQPHFLFNALNAISELVHENPERADRMIGRLSELLRAAFEAGDRHLTTLDAELGLVDHYLAIQRVRFGDRLRVETHVPDDCRRVEVPQLFLQPLVENAVVHGLSPRVEGGSIRIAVERRGSTLVVTVEDDGVGVGAQPAPGGIGLSNSRARLRSLYGDAASIELGARQSGGTMVTVTLPCAS